MIGAQYLCAFALRADANLHMLTMNKRKLGHSGLAVNEIGYGSMTLGLDAERRPTELAAIELLQHAVDECGVDLIDTADAYCADESEMGYVERLIGRALTGDRRHRVVVATKGGFERQGNRWIPNGRPAYLRAACERSLVALATDAIDLYQLHRPDPGTPFEDSIGALIELKAEGKIRHIGVSNVTLEQLSAAIALTDISTVQEAFAPMSYSTEKAELLRFCEQNEIAWIAYGPMGGHRNSEYTADLVPWMRGIVPDENLTPNAVMLAWSLRMSPMVIPIPGTTNLDHLRENMRAASIVFDANQVELLSAPRTWLDYHDEHKERGDLAAAIEQLHVGLALHPNDANILYNLACDLALGGQSAAALETLERARACGFGAVEHVRQDEDFAIIRDSPEFAAVIERMSADSTASQ